MYGGIICSCCTESELSKNSGVNYYVNPTPQPRLGAGVGAVLSPCPASSGSLSDFLAVPAHEVLWWAGSDTAVTKRQEGQVGMSSRVIPAPLSWHGISGRVAMPNHWRGDAETSGMLFPVLRKSLKSSRWGECSGRPLAVYCPFINGICSGTESSCCTNSPEYHSGFGQCVAGIEFFWAETRNIISYLILPTDRQWFLLSLLHASSPKCASVSSNNMLFDFIK